MKSEKLVSLVKEMADYGGAVEKNSGGITYYKNRYGYVLGAQGETYTKELAQKWGDQKRSGKTATYFVTNCKKWYTPPRKVVDCSGMIVLAMRTEDSDYGDRTANTFKNQFTQSGRIGTLPDIPGVAVWKNGHIGIYIGNNLVVEARGYAYGVVVSKVSANSWTYWGKLKDVEYGGGASAGTPETPEATAPPTNWTVSRLLKKTSPLMSGTDVKNVQKALIAKGYSCGSSGADGKYGDDTVAAVKKFQKAKGLSVDGQAGKNTVTALGGKWNG